jgi:hypothetical protein
MIIGARDNNCMLTSFTWSRKLSALEMLSASTEFKWLMGKLLSAENNNFHKVTKHEHH